MSLATVSSPGRPAPVVIRLRKLAMYPPHACSQMYAATYGEPPDPPAALALLDALRTAARDLTKTGAR
jgi:hypothetical protein